MDFMLSYVFGLLLGICLADHHEESSVCYLPADGGLCYAYFPSFYYNAASGKCLDFVYGGCGGNGNRFSTVEECMKRCGGAGERSSEEVSSQQRPSICNQEKKVGRCEAMGSRYWFNQATGQCEHFFYGGCEGNDNNFGSEEECEKTCLVIRRGTPVTGVCSQDKQPGNCSSRINRFYFNKNSGKCESFIYTGCGENDNNFQYIFECERSCPGELDLGDICSLDSQSGMCLAYIQRYFFNKETGKCEEFIFGGCGGNHNNFRNQQECENFCKARYADKETDQILSSSVLAEDICNQEKKPGNCESQINRYYFNKESRKCETFVYTGCGENDNNFGSLFECERTCPGDLDLGDVCGLEKKQGPCRARMPRYYFNRKTGQCERFIYGGCSGNYNNFENITECESYCKAGKKPSSL